MITFRQDAPLKDYDSVSLAAMLRKHFIENYPAHFTKKLDDAIQIASYLHRFDVRRGNRGKMSNPPYIEHPLRVALRLITAFGVTDPYLILAAVLHDTVEDHPFEFSAFEGVPTKPTDETDARYYALVFISEKLGFTTADWVKDVSNPILPEGTSKTDKVSLYQEHVSNIVKVSSPALIIKVSDFVDNAGSLHHHYEYNDPKVTYFLDRYGPLIPVYQAALIDRVQFLWDEDKALDRVNAVQDQFTTFRTELAKREALV